MAGSTGVARGNHGPRRGQERRDRARLALPRRQTVAAILAVAVFQALRGNCDEGLPEDVRKLAVAVECFHKASLIHDDIEDNDAIRYGEKTLHEEHGLAVALNVGDLLIGEGYRLIGALECEREADGLKRSRVASTWGTL